MNETLQTHWSDCWREPGHHACAIRRIEQLEAQLTKRDAPCVWKFDSDVFEYVSCTGDWFDERMKFCPDCGHPVQRETHDNAKKRNERLTRKGCETMSEGLQGRIMHEARRNKNALMTAYAGDLAEMIEELTARAERAEAALAAVRSDEMIERLADQQHAIWSHWMEYLFSCCAEADDGSMLIPVEKVERWQRQMLTPYSNLSESEQKSDIDQAGKIIAVGATVRQRFIAGQ